jgi:hypothetical protein
MFLAGFFFDLFFGPEDEGDEKYSVIYQKAKLFKEVNADSNLQIITTYDSHLKMLTCMTSTYAMRRLHKCCLLQRF